MRCYNIANKFECYLLTNITRTLKTVGEKFEKCTASKKLFLI